MTLPTVLGVVVDREQYRQYQDLLYQDRVARLGFYSVCFLTGVRPCPAVFADGLALFVAFETLRENYSPSVASVTSVRVQHWS